MKTLIIVLFSFIAAQTIPAQDAKIPAEKKTLIVENLNAGVKSENVGLHTSAALVLSDLINHSYLQSNDASRTMIPLLKLLKQGKTDEERIAAAVALYQLGNAIGIYSLKCVAVSDDNSRVAQICKNLYYSYHKLHNTEYLVSF